MSNSGPIRSPAVLKERAKTPRPKYFPLLAQNLPAAASPVISFLRTQLKQREDAIDVTPKFFPFIPRFTPVAAANPVIQFRIGQWLGDEKAPRIPRPFFFNVIRNDVEPPVPPVILFRRPDIEWLKERDWHRGFEPHFGPVIRLLLSYSDYECFIQYDTTQYTTPTELFEVVIHGDGTNVASARLFNITDDIPVAGSTLSTTSGTFVRLRSGDLSLTGTKEYKAQACVPPGGTTTLCGARLIIQT